MSLVTICTDSEPTDGALLPPVRLLTIAEAAQLLRLSTKTIRRHVKAGRIPAFRVLGNGPWLFDRDVLIGLLSPISAEGASSSTSLPAAIRPAAASTEVEWLADLAGAG